MKSAAVSPAPFSFRTLILIGAFAAPMLLCPGLAFPQVTTEIPFGAQTGTNSQFLADVNRDGFADLIYTLRVTSTAPQTNVYVQYSNGSGFGAPVVVATDSSTTAPFRACSGCGTTNVPEALVLAVGD